MKAGANIDMVGKVAAALGDLRNRVVFVGGAVVELYATDPAAPAPRPTVDVDCIVQITSRRDYRRIERGLEKRGFRHDTSRGAPLCRWLCGELAVDIMPTDATLLGFANRWHVAGIDHKVQYTLGAETSIGLLTPPYFVASKLEALDNRGGADWRGAPDFEDVVFIVHNRPELPTEIGRAPEDVRNYLTAQFANHLENATLREDVVSAVPPQLGARAVDEILARMQEIAQSTSE
ncbi:MAG: hypothetical protein R6X33_14875 [Candidatus Brocadiia bacterium]